MLLYRLTRVARNKQYILGGERDPMLEINRHGGELCEAICESEQYGAERYCDFKEEEYKSLAHLVYFFAEMDKQVLLQEYFYEWAFKDRKRIPFCAVVNSLYNTGTLKQRNDDYPLDPDAWNRRARLFN